MLNVNLQLAVSTLDLRQTSKRISLQPSLGANRPLEIRSTFHIFLPPANEVWGKVIFLHLSLILFTGGSTPQQVSPPTRYTPGPGTPPRTRYTPLGTRYTPLGTRYTPPGTRYTPQDQVHPPRPGTPPTGMHSCSN